MDRSPGFGSTATNLNRPFKTRFRFGSTCRLNLARNGNSRTHYAKGTQSACSLKNIGLPQLVGKRFQVLFHSPPGVLFAFPSRYWFTIGHQGVFSLGRWSSRIHAGFHVSRATQVPLGVSIVSCTGLSPSLELLSKSFAYNLLSNYSGPTTPAHMWTGLGSSLFARRYWGNRVFFPFPGYLDVSVPRVLPPPTYVFSRGFPPFDGRVAPFGYLRVTA